MEEEKGQKLKAEGQRPQGRLSLFVFLLPSSEQTLRRKREKERKGK